MKKPTADEHRRLAALEIMSIKEIDDALNIECITYDMLIKRLNTKGEIFRYLPDLYTFLSTIGVTRSAEAKKKCRTLYYDYEGWKRNTQKTLQEKYGNDITNISQLDSVKKAKKETFENNYGPGLLMANERFKQMAEQRNMELYGYKNPFDSKDVQDKILRNAERKYGLDENSIINVSQIPAIRDKVNQTNLIKYGNICQLNSFDRIRERRNIAVDGWKPKPEYLDILKDDDLTLAEINKIENPTGPKIADYFGIPLHAVYTIMYRHNLWDILVKSSTNIGTASALEIEFKNWLEELTGKRFEKRSDLLEGKQEIDLYNDELKLAIEFNGAYWHSDIHVNKRYHENKSKLCEKAGIRLIHIYDYEWLDLGMRDKLTSLLNIACNNVKTKIYARNCEVHIITNSEARAFNELNHLQGHRNAKLTYGLFYEGKLVQLMSFSKNKKYEWEIIRGCPGSNNIVVGGVEKLFSHFVRDQDPQEVFSYCDFNKFDGKSYSAIGMKFIGYTGPDKTWILHGCPIKRNASRYKELKETAEYIVWGSGSKKYLWTSK